MTRALVALVALALALPAASLAKAPQTNAPPGNSGIQQYLETVPGASGDRRPVPPGHAGGGGGGGSGLTPSQRASLERQGADGKTLANAIDATSSGKTSKKQLTLPKGDGRSPAGDLFGAATGSNGGGGMGILLPAILIAVLLAAILAVLLRRRATS